MVLIRDFSRSTIGVTLAVFVDGCVLYGVPVPLYEKHIVPPFHLMTSDIRDMISSGIELLM